MANKKEKHPCQGDYLDKLIQPIVLSLICEEPSHGFHLLNRMLERGLAEDADATGFYRTLQKLESAGKLNAEWEICPGQKPRKVYTITEKGLRCLQNWQATLKNYSVHVVKVSGLVDAAIVDFNVST